MKKYHYNDNNVLSIDTRKELEDKLYNGFISIPIYYDITIYGDVQLDIEMILEEFQRTLSGIETVVDDLQDKPIEEME